ncbi:MAG: sensor domain-containing diguanylate cyclase [Actinomycetota bacterium]
MVHFSLRCVRVLLAGLLAVALVGSAPVAAQGDIGDDTGFGPQQVSYPDEWNPEVNPDVRPAGYIFPNATINLENGAVYDPFVAEVILPDGTVTDLDGNVLYVDGFLANILLTPEEFNQLVAQGAAPQWGPLDGTPDGLQTYYRALPSDRPDGGPDEVQPGGQTTDTNTDTTTDEATDDTTNEATAEPDEVAAADDATFQTPEDVAAQPHPMEDKDEILPNYRLGTDLSLLGDFAFSTEGIPREVVEEALQFTAYEIALLVQLNAFDQQTPWYSTFAEIHGQFAFDDDISRRNLIATLGTVDVQQQSRSALFGRVTTLEDQYVTWTINTMPGGFTDDLVNGQTGFINGFEYAAGLMRLMATAEAEGSFSTGLAADAVAGDTEVFTIQVALEGALEALDLQQDLNQLLRLEVSELQAAVAALANPVVSEIAPAVGDLGGDDGDLVLYSAIAGLGGLLILGAIFFLLRQRRADKRAPEPLRYDQDAAMATNQLLAGARDEDEIVRILDRASETQVGHPTVLFHAVNDGLQPVGSKTILTGSDLNRVVTSGQRAMTVLRNDPAFPGETHAVMALPVIHGGRVQAVLAAHRPGEQPFTDADRSRLEPIAPALGGALETASELGTLTKLAMVDGLTSLGNRRRLDGDLETNLASAVAGDAPLGFAMIDVDHFKTYNDTHGHAAGDEVLRKVAATIERCVRESDVVYRYGGEEFSILFPGATPEEAAQVAERVRATVEAEPFAGEERQPGGSLTISVGVATLATGGADDIRERADQALYQAKHNGRNQVAYA